MPSLPDPDRPFPATVLCPTDFSAASQRALAYAVAVARPAQAKVTFLHVCPLPIPSVEEDDLPEWMPDGRCPTTDLVDELRRFAEPARAAGLTTSLLIRDGDPGDEIVRAARSLGSDLIVMGSHGRRGWRRILGSHAERVLRTAACPVLTVGGPVGTGPGPAIVRIDRILCAASGSEHSAVTVDCASRLATAMGAQLTLVHVSDPAHRIELGLAAPEWMPPAGVSVEQRVAEGSPWAEIRRSAQEHAVDLIVVGRHDEGPALGLFGSTSGEMHAGECGVLTVGTVSPGKAADRRPAGPSVEAHQRRGNEVGHGRR